MRHASPQRSDPQVHVTIDRLVLRGFSPQQREAVARALEASLRAELARQLGQPGQGLPASRAVAGLRLPALHLSAGAPSGMRIGGEAGRALARGIYK